jgi:U4/U6.U5 tri-snRNP component SNU23
VIQMGTLITSTVVPVRLSIVALSPLIPPIDLRHLGQTTTIERSTLEQVRERIAQLRAETKEKTTAKTFDFEKRLAEVRAIEEQKREEKKRKKLVEKQANTGPAPDQDIEMTVAMGFAGFGSTKQA